MYTKKFSKHSLSPLRKKLVTYLTHTFEGYDDLFAHFDNSTLKFSFSYFGQNFENFILLWSDELTMSFLEGKSGKKIIEILTNGTR